MTKREFINILNDELKNSLDNDNLKKQLDYYDNYISTEVENGKKEVEVLSELGDPRLIAKTIKQVNGDNMISDDTSYNDNYSKHNYNNSHSNTSNKNTNSNYYITNFGALGCIVFFLIFLFIIVFVLRLLGVVVFGSIAAGSGSFIGFIITLLIIYYLFNSFRRR